MIPNQQGDNDSKRPDSETTPGHGALLSWVMTKVKHGRDVRDAENGDMWKEFTRLWRGFHSDRDKTTDSERSKLISPASQQAVEMTCSEMEESTFGRTAWFDITDDIDDEQKDDAIAYRDRLLQDFEMAGMPEAISDAYLLGCIYGTGILKVNMELKEGRQVAVVGEAVRPDEFVIDPSATSIPSALFCAHEVVKPKHTIKAKQARGLYMKGNVTSYAGAMKGSTTGYESSKSVQDKDDGVLITEYYGKVPSLLLPEGDPEGGMVEALVTIANENLILKAVASPFTNKDRPIVAYQHDSVPGQFWGRGVIEKGYNPQKALDAELRARIDSLALVTAPMMGADITKMPKNPDLRTRPGKWLLTRGRPSEIIEPIGFQAPNLAASFQNAGDLERMVQMATGAMDTATPLGTNRRNETMGGMSMMSGAFLKRSKRTMRRVEKFLDHVITKSLWRYMQFDPQRYPEDMVFVVNSTMGMMAREVENQNLVQMLAFVPPESPAHGLIIQALLENTNSSEKDVMKAAIQEMNKPPSEEEKQMQQLQQQMQIEGAQEELKKMKLENMKTEAEIALIVAKTQHEEVVTDLEDDKIELQAANAATGAEKARMANDQNIIAADRNRIEEKKLDKLGAPKKK